MLVKGWTISRRGQHGGDKVLEVTNPHLLVIGWVELLSYKLFAAFERPIRFRKEEYDLNSRSF